jgi:hypothetical protein
MRACGWLLFCFLGCISRSPYVCTTGAQCVSSSGPGICQASGFCSFPDGSCIESGQRYGEAASADLANQCVAGGGFVSGGPYNYVFVTSQLYVPGSLAMSAAQMGLPGPLDFADSECQRLAMAGHLPGHYIAWLSTTSIDARSRLGSARGWIRPDGRPFADSLTTLLIDGRVLYPPILDEGKHDLTLAGGTGLPSVIVATGTIDNGTRAADTANDWTSTSGKYNGGDALATTGYWDSGQVLSGQAPGQDRAHLYCFGTDFGNALSSVRTTGRTAFLSAGYFSPTGTAAADTLCQNEARANGLAGTYLALLSTSSKSASARFDLSGPTWLRKDGIPWLASAQDLARGAVLTSLNLDASGMYWGYCPVWSGGADPSVPASGAGQNCGDWGDEAQTGVVGWCDYTAKFGFSQSSHSCGDRAVHVYCLQQ